MAESETDLVFPDAESRADREAIESELRALDGVMEQEWSEDAGRVHVRFDHDLLAEGTIKRTVRELGYTVEDGE